MKYYDIREKLPQLRDISIIIGGRGIGKTYDCMVTNNEFADSKKSEDDDRNDRRRR